MKIAKAEKILKSLADGTRLRILAIITEGEICACRLPARLRISQPAASQHLKVLSGAGMLKMRKEGARRLYSLTARGKRALDDVSGWTE